MVKKFYFNPHNSLTLKNHAPDFFHISLCSAQILQSQILSFPSSGALAPINPPIVEVNIEVTEELEDNEAARPPPPSLFRFEFFWSFLCWFEVLVEYSNPHFPQALLPHSAQGRWVV